MRWDHGNNQKEQSRVYGASSTCVPQAVLRYSSTRSDIRVRRNARLAGERPIRVLQFTGSGSVSGKRLWLDGLLVTELCSTLPGQRPTSHMPKLLLIKEKQRKKQLPNTQIELSAFFFRTPCPSSRRPSCSAVVPPNPGVTIGK
jgi:hypothetical protein